ncbi:hypothetical protein [Halomonas huangheensis]|uniref:Uncharacterized protein n=1 Tax=Halomonas huangheensis TaxID=1178482 RepID=W1NAJ2_9GAMM|nr:hypothetical protein [Halomonas huangheensis]ALM54070.1 hypothetical protein AR456_18660 [Halomonas huangheensis]ERL52544.1 hypothetical protein BJB45_08300 [Halomonas huangheensis]
MSSRKFSVLRLLSNLANSAPSPSSSITPAEDDDGSRANTTLRLEPAVRKFVDDQAKHYGVSSQQFIAMMLKGLMTGGSHEMVQQASLMESRIYDVFARNKLSPSQVAIMLSPFGINASVLKDPQSLLEKVTPEMISHLSDKFGVKEEWLNGVSDQIFSDRNYDRSQFQLVQEILKEKDSTDRVHVHFVMEDGYQPLEDEGESSWAKSRVHAGFIIEFQTEEATKYLIIRHQPWGYKRTRIEMKTFLMFLERGEEVYYPVRGYQGWIIEKNKFDALFSGTVWPSDILEFRAQGVKTGANAEVYLEDMVDQDGQALEEFEVEDVSLAYESSKLPLFHKAYREIFTTDPEVIKKYISASEEERAEMKESLLKSCD